MMLEYLKGYSKKNNDVYELIEDIGGEDNLTEFRDVKDWIMSLIITGIKTGFKGMENDDAVQLARILCRDLGQPQNTHKWNYIIGRIDRYGLRTMIHKIRREFLWGIK